MQKKSKQTYSWWTVTTPGHQSPHYGIFVFKFPKNIYLFKVNNRNTRKRCKICSKLMLKTPKRRHWHCSSVFIDNFEHLSHLFLVLLLSTISREMFSEFIQTLTYWSNIVTVYSQCIWGFWKTLIGLPFSMKLTLFNWTVAFYCM